MTIEIASGADAVANIAGQPANVILYGPPGSGKTTDAITTFCKDGKCSAFVIPCEDGALKPILARGLPVPDHVRSPVKSWSEMEQAMAWLWQNRGRYSACVIDGLSTFTTYLNKEIEEKYAGSKNKFIVWTTMRNCLYMIREWLRAIGLHGVFTCHAMSPVVQDGVFYLGGPMLSPKTMIESYYGLVDTVLRVDHLTIPGKPPTRVYWTGGLDWPSELGPLAQPPPDWRGWRAKNREGCGRAIVPADLGAFLRSRTPPYPGL